MYKLIIEEQMAKASEVRGFDRRTSVNQWTVVTVKE
jgi:hypothetical protein